jgi:hypothetical protein
MYKNKSSLKTVLFGLAILATMLFLKVVYAQEKKELSLKLLSQEPIEKPQKHGLVRTVFSKNGKFKGTIVRREVIKYTSIYKFSLLDSTGSVIWEKDTFSPYPFIANDGSVVTWTLLGDAGSKSIFSFYDPAGNLIKRTEPLLVVCTEINPEILPEGNYLLLNVDKPDVQEGLHIFDLKGNLIKNYGPCDNYAVSPGLKNLIISSGSELRFYRDGNLIGKRKVESHYARGMVISPDGDYFAFLTRNRLSLFEIGKVKKLWQKDLKADLRFTSVDLSWGAKRIVVGAAVVLATHKLANKSYTYTQIYNENGERIAEQKIEITEWFTWVPKVNISEDGKLLNVEANEIYKFELE